MTLQCNALKSPPPCGEVEMLKRRQPRGISGGGIAVTTLPPPEIARGRARSISTSPQGGGHLGAR